MKSRIHLADLCPHCDANDCNIYNSSAEMRRVKMSKVKIMTDSNSGITQDQGRALGVEVVPMPFFIDETQYFEDISMSQKDFYQALLDDKVNVSTSQPSPEAVMEVWTKLLSEYDEIVHIPMSCRQRNWPTAVIPARKYMIY